MVHMFQGPPYRLYNCCKMCLNLSHTWSVCVMQNYINLLSFVWPLMCWKCNGFHDMPTATMDILLIRFWTVLVKDWPLFIYRCVQDSEYIYYLFLCLPMCAYLLLNAIHWTSFMVSLPKETVNKGSFIKGMNWVIWLKSLFTKAPLSLPYFCIFLFVLSIQCQYKTSAMICFLLAFNMIFYILLFIQILWHTHPIYFQWVWWHIN